MHRAVPLITWNKPLHGGHNYEVGQVIQLTAPGQGLAQAQRQGLAALTQGQGLAPLGPSPCLFAVFEKNEMNKVALVRRANENPRRKEEGESQTGTGVNLQRWVNRGLTQDMICYHSNLHGNEELPGEVVSDFYPTSSPTLPLAQF